MNAVLDGDLVSSSHFQEALNWLTRLLVYDLRTSREPVVKDMIRLTGGEEEDVPRIQLLAAGFLLIISRSPPSPGYEALLINRGENPLLARVKAYLTVKPGQENRQRK